MSTGYSAGMRYKTITIYNRTAATTGTYGVDSDGATWQLGSTIHAAVDFVRGIRAMKEGALDVYGVVMVRCNYTTELNPRSRIQYNGQMYQILGETFHAEYRDNTIQFHAQLLDV